MSLNERVRQVISAAFGVPLEQVPPQAAVGTVDGWDSMGHVALIGELERAFGTAITLDEAMNLTSVEQICRCLQSKSIQA